MSKVIECSSDYEYQGAIGNSGDSLMLVEFYSNWSTPSQVVSQDLESLRIEYPDLIHVRINFDSCPEVFQKYNISILPSIKLLREGLEIACIRGASIIKIRQLVEENY